MGQYITRKYHNRKIEEERRETRAAIRDRNEFRDRADRFQVDMSRLADRNEVSDRQNRNLESQKDVMLAEIRNIEQRISEWMVCPAHPDKHELSIERQYGQIEAALRLFLEKYDDFRNGMMGVNYSNGDKR